MELFDIINAIFNSQTEYEKVTKTEKRKSFFMINRRFAIQFPLQANILQLNNITQEYVIDFWQWFMRQKYKSTPHWIYTKGVKKTQQIKEKKDPISKDTILAYSKYMKIEERSIKEALEFFPEEMIKELKMFEKIIKQ